MLEGHISKAFDGELAALHIRVLEMGGLVLDQVREATRPTPTGMRTAAQLRHRARGAGPALCRTIYDDQLH